MSRIPRSICGSELTSDNSLNDVLISSSSSSSTASSASASSMVNYAGDNEQIEPSTGEEGQMNSLMGMGGDVRINPLAGMGLTEERYQAILKDIVSGENLTGIGVPEALTFDLMEGNATGGMDVGLGVSLGMGEKRGLDEDGDGMREGKRGRFELLD